MPISSSVSPSQHHATTVSAGEQHALDVREQPQRAQERADLLVEARGRSRAGAAPGRRRTRSRRARARPPATAAGVWPGGRVGDVGPRQQREQRGQHRGVEQALGDHRGEDLAPPRGRAAAEQPDAQQLAAAHRQHVVAHVADERRAGRRRRARAGSRSGAGSGASGSRARASATRVGADRGRTATPSRRPSRGTAACPAWRSTTRPPPARRPRRATLSPPLELGGDPRHVSVARGGGAACGSRCPCVAPCGGRRPARRRARRDAGRR